jgi:hypothetical protein
MKVTKANDQMTPAMNRLEAQLRRRYPSAAAAMRALGLDEKTIDEVIKENKQMKALQRRARDEEQDPGGWTAEELIDAVTEANLSMPSDEQFEFAVALRKCLDNGFAKDKERRRALDNPPSFPGRPNPGGERDPLDREGEDRRHRLGADARPHGFDERFPGVRDRVLPNQGGRW